MNETIHCQAKDNTGTTVFDLQLEGRKNKHGLISQALAAIKATGGMIRYHETGFTYWLKYNVQPGQGFAVQDQSIDWPE